MAKNDIVRPTNEKENTPQFSSSSEFAPDESQSGLRRLTRDKSRPNESGAYRRNVAGEYESVFFEADVASKTTEESITVEYNLDELDTLRLPTESKTENNVIDLHANEQRTELENQLSRLFPSGNREELDRETIAGCIAGDPRALSRMVRTYQVWVRRIVSGFLVGRLRSVIEAADITQDIWVHICHVIQNDKYSQIPNCRFSTWLFRVVTNHTRDKLRQLRRSQNMAPHEAWEDYIQSTEIPLNTTRFDVLLEQRKAIGSALARLDDDDRIVIVLSQIELTNEEFSIIFPSRGTLPHAGQTSDIDIATLIGTTPANVRSMRARAMKKLQAVLADQNGRGKTP